MEHLGSHFIQLATKCVSWSHHVILHPIKLKHLLRIGPVGSSRGMISLFGHIAGTRRNRKVITIGVKNALRVSNYTSDALITLDQTLIQPSLRSITHYSPSNVFTRTIGPTGIIGSRIKPPSFAPFNLKRFSVVLGMPKRKEQPSNTGTKS